MNWQFIIDCIPRYLAALRLTALLGVAGVALSALVGLVCCLAVYYRVPVLRRLVAVYTELSRNTPLLIQLFFLYYGLPKVGIKLSGTTCAIVGLTFLGGSYMAEAFRAGIEAVRKSQLEAGLSIGMNRAQLTRYVVFPQMLSVAVPALGANALFLLKETSVFSIIAVADLMNVTKELIGIHYNTAESLAMLVVFYLILLLPLSALFTLLERRLRRAEFGV